MLYQGTIDLYKDVIKPPEEGFKLEWLEMTTFSLSKDMLRLIAAMVIYANSSCGRKGAMPKYPNRIIKTFRNEKSVESGKLPFHVFYDGKIMRENEDEYYYNTADGKYALYLFNEYCTPVKENGLFHPKIVLAQFSKDGEKKFRICISSQNLTFSNYLEAGIVLESVKDDKENDDAVTGEALSNFFKKYYKEENCPIDLDSLSKAKLAICFDADSNPKLKGIFFGKQEHLIDKMKELSDEYDSLRVVSMNPQPKELKSISAGTKEFICNFKDMYEYELKSNNWTKHKENHWFVGEIINGICKPKPLHIKAYYFWNSKKKDKILTFIGSANCSANGLTGGNEEVLVAYTQESDDSNYFPCCQISSSSKLSKIAGYEYRFFSPDTPDNVEIDEVEDEETLIRLDLEISDVQFDDQNEKLSFQATNNTGTDLTLRIASTTLPQLKAGAEAKFEISMTKANFSNLLLIQAPDSPLRSMLLPIKWGGKDYDNLRRALPEEPVGSLSELMMMLEESFEGDTTFLSPYDEPFERLTKCRMFLDEEKYNKYVDHMYENIKPFLNGNNDNEASDDDQKTLSFIETNKTEIERFCKLLNALKGEEVKQNGTH